MKKVILAIGTGLGAGYLPLCPGTLGTLWGVVIYGWIGILTTNLLWSIAVALGILFLGVWIGGECELFLKKKDHPAIVIDEVGGFLVGMIGIPLSLSFLALGFILFRVFDIVKPFRIDKLHRLPAGWGIVTDDLAAGVLTNLFLRILISMFGW